jgi:hypothetical protein
LVVQLELLGTVEYAEIELRKRIKSEDVECKFCQNLTILDANLETVFFTATGLSDMEI